MLSASSARVTMATRVSRSAISTGMPRSTSPASTARPSAPVPGETEGELDRVDPGAVEDAEPGDIGQPVA